MVQQEASNSLMALLELNSILRAVQVGKRAAESANNIRRLCYYRDDLDIDWCSRERTVTLMWVLR
jgi:hypothetical protein